MQTTQQVSIGQSRKASRKSAAAPAAPAAVQVSLNGAADLTTAAAPVQEVSGAIRDSAAEAAKSAVPMEVSNRVSAVLESIQHGNGAVVVESATHPRLAALNGNGEATAAPAETVKREEFGQVVVAKVTSSGAPVLSTREKFNRTYSGLLASLKAAEKSDKDAFNSFKVFSAAKWTSPAEDKDERDYRQLCWNEYKVAMREAMGVEVSIGGKDATVQRIANARVVWDSRTGMPKRWSQTLTIGGDIPEAAIAEHVDSLKRCHAAVQALIGA